MKNRTNKIYSRSKLSMSIIMQKLSAQQIEESNPCKAAQEASDMCSSHRLIYLRWHDELVCRLSRLGQLVLQARPGALSEVQFQILTSECMHSSTEASDFLLQTSTPVNGYLLYTYSVYKVNTYTS